MVLSSGLYVVRFVALGRSLPRHCTILVPPDLEIQPKSKNPIRPCQRPCPSIPSALSLSRTSAGLNGAIAAAAAGLHRMSAAAHTPPRRLLFPILGNAACLLRGAPPPPRTWERRPRLDRWTRQCLLPPIRPLCVPRLLCRLGAAPNRQRPLDFVIRAPLFGAPTSRRSEMTKEGGRRDLFAAAAT
jgi:hypothetical protein